MNYSINSFVVKRQGIIQNFLSYHKTFFVFLYFFFLIFGSLEILQAGFITINNGYFYDPDKGEPWVPHGVAYQTWNRPLGVWQTHDQIDYDLDEFVKMGVNSIRVDFVWQHVEEDGDNQWKWENYDYLNIIFDKNVI